jgi:uncharacterized protein YegL
MSQPLGQGYDERIPLVLVLDTSQSMARPPEAPRITALNRALTDWLRDTRKEPRLSRRLEVAIIAFGSSVRVLDPATGRDGPADAATAFAPVTNVADPELTPHGYTLMLPAISQALGLAQGPRRRQESQGMPSRRPLIWLLTDGAASDAEGRPLDAASMARTAEQIRAAEHAPEQVDQCLFCAIGVGAADQDMLESLAPDSTLMLDHIGYRSILTMITGSTESVRSSDTPAEAHQRGRDIAGLTEQLRQLEDEQRRA